MLAILAASKCLVGGRRLLQRPHPGGWRQCRPWNAKLLLASARPDRGAARRLGRSHRPHTVPARECWAVARHAAPWLVARLAWTATRPCAWAVTKGSVSWACWAAASVAASSGLPIVGLLGSRLSSPGRSQASPDPTGAAAWCHLHSRLAACPHHHHHCRRRRGRGAGWRPGGGCQVQTLGRCDLETRGGSLREAASRSSRLSCHCICCHSSAAASCHCTFRPSLCSCEAAGLALPPASAGWEAKPPSVTAERVNEQPLDRLRSQPPGSVWLR